MTARLYIAARAPRPGEVKTRLARCIGPVHAARLYAAFLRDLGRRFADAPFGLGWYVTPAGAWAEIAPLVPPRAGVLVREQPAADWTDRQRHLLRRATVEGEVPVALMASDSPHVEVGLVARALALLGEHELVLGPSADGGYYLIGMRGWHDVLAGVSMSRADVLAQVLRRVRELGLRTALLPARVDIDEEPDLTLLGQIARERGDLPATRRALAALEIPGGEGEPAARGRPATARADCMAGRRALVTGGAGFIGSWLVDLLVAEGWRVRVLDNLERQTHGGGRPAWINPRAELRLGDVCRADDIASALEGIDVVFHLAAYGGYMPEIARYLEVNALGTARLLEVIRDHRLPVRKIVVASSQAVYVEGAVRCPEHGLRFPPRRRLSDLASGRFEVPCPSCGAPAAAAPTPESAPTGGETVYAISKAAQERLVLAWGAQVGVPVVALRYACTYGPRQSLFNPYTGVITIFCSRLINGLAPLVYEDGSQTRDLCFVEDIARANLIAAETDRLDGLAVNVGTGQPTAIGELARMLASALGVALEPDFPGSFRPGEMRALTPDISLAQAAGFGPRVSLEAGIARYLDWLQAAGPITELFTAAERRLREQRVVRTARPPEPPR
jgi:dTDP-L-rhamnose 4-epimerase